MNVNFKIQSRINAQEIARRLLNGDDAQATIRLFTLQEEPLHTEGLPLATFQFTYERQQWGYKEHTEHVCFTDLHELEYWELEELRESLRLEHATCAAYDPDHAREREVEQGAVRPDHLVVHEAFVRVPKSDERSELTPTARSRADDYHRESEEDGFNTWAVKYKSLPTQRPDGWCFAQDVVDQYIRLRRQRDAAEKRLAALYESYADPEYAFLIA